jgi:hypothetical protein
VDPHRLLVNVRLQGVVVVRQVREIKSHKPLSNLLVNTPKLFIVLLFG